MHLFRQMARAYFMHRLSSPPGPAGPSDRHATTGGPTPLRWIRDLGFEVPGRRDHHGVRASDADREQVASFLKRHCAEGRLSTDELASRVEAAYTAVGLSELDRLAADLPGSPFTPPAAQPVPPRSFVGPAAHVAAIGAGLFVLFALVSLLAPAEVWVSLLMLLVPLGAFALISILPFALPVIAVLLLARTGGWTTSLDHRRHRRHLSAGRHGTVQVWRW